MDGCERNSGINRSNVSLAHLHAHFYVAKRSLDKRQVHSSHLVPDAKEGCFTIWAKYIYIKKKLQCFGTIPAKYIKA